MKIPGMAVVATAAATMVAANVQGADIRVPQDVATIQGAIAAANAGDRVLVAPGTYREQVNLSGKRVIVLGVAGAASTILDGEGNRTVVLGQNEPAGCELSGFTIQNGSGDLAGGMLVTNSAVNVHDCVFRSNSASNWYGGAGFRSQGGAPVVTDCRFIQNRALSNSTASSWYHFGTGNFDLRRCTFDGNVNTGSGVAVKVNPEFQTVNGTVRDCVFVGPRLVEQDQFSWGCVQVHASIGTAIEVSGCRFSAAGGGQSFAVVASAGSTVRVTNCDGCGFVSPLLLSSESTGEMIASTFAPTCGDCNANGIPDLQEVLQGTAPDTDANGIPDVCEAPTCRNADLFVDGQVNGADLAALLSQWGPANAGTVSDIDHDGRVDGYDLSILLSFWGPCGP